MCSICIHPAREAIDLALVAGESGKKIAAKYRDISDDSLTRHRAAHLPRELAKAKEAEVVRADSLLDRLLALNRETAAILREARAAKDNELALKAIARAEKQIELEGRLIGELSEGQTINILVAPEWLNLRVVILRALEPYPEARIALAAAIAEVEGVAS